MAFPNESAEYRSARDALLAKEIELRRATEDVAAARRALPPGGEIMRDYVFEDEEGNTMPLLNVFERDGETIRHFWGSEVFWAPSDPGQEPRHLSTIEPLWNLLDLTREGRPDDFWEQLSYSRI